MVLLAAARRTATPANLILPGFTHSVNPQWFEQLLKLSATSLSVTSKVGLMPILSSTGIVRSEPDCWAIESLIEPL
jgi:hypothetical protein